MKEPDRRVLRLSGAFRTSAKTQKPCLECTAVMLNINYGHNQKLMDKCQRLKEYSLFVKTVREHCAQEKDVRLAVSDAVEECIQNDILKDVLLKNHAEVMDVALSCTREKYEQMIRNEEYEKGKREGEHTLSYLIQSLLAENKYDEIGKVTTDPVYRELLYQKYHIREIEES